MVPVLAELPIPPTIPTAFVAIALSTLSGVIVALWAWGKRKDARLLKELEEAKKMKDFGVELRETMRRELQKKIDALEKDKDALQERMIAREREIAEMGKKEPAVDRAMDILYALQRKGVLRKTPPFKTQPVDDPRRRKRTLTEKMDALESCTAQIDLAELKELGLDVNALGGPDG